MRYWFAPWYSAHSWQEDGEVTTQITHVTADGQSFGAWQDPVFGTPTWARSAARRGVSGTSDGRAYYECSGTGSNDELVIQDSQDLFRSFHDSRRGTICMWIQPVTANGTSFSIADNNALTTAQRGIYIDRTTANRVNFVVTGAGAPAVVCNNTTVATITTGAWHSLCARYDGSGNVELNINGTEETGTCAGAASVGSSGQEFSFCGRVAGTGSASMRIAELVISDQRWTDTQVAAWRAIPANGRTTTPIGCSAPGVCPFLHTSYEFGNRSSLWEDAGATDPVDTAGDSVHVVRDTRPDGLTNYLRRQATSVDATRPTWVSSTAGIEFPGSTTQTLAWQGAWERGGSRTVFTIASCDDTTLGCHLSYAGAGQYAVITGTNYSGNVTSAYYLMHLPGSTTVLTTTNTIALPGGENCVVWSRDGASWRGGTIGGVISTDYNVQSYRAANIGQESNAGWSMDGYVRGIRSYNMSIPQSEWALICANMNAEASGGSGGLVSLNPTDGQVACHPFADPITIVADCQPPACPFDSQYGGGSPTASIWVGSVLAIDNGVAVAGWDYSYTASLSNTRATITLEPTGGWDPATTYNGTGGVGTDYTISEARVWVDPYWTGASWTPYSLNVLTNAPTFTTCP